MEKVCEREICFGCYSCFNICPQKAISMNEDEYGSIVPVINKKDCIDCGLCKSVCPAINTSDFRQPVKTYASITKDEHDYLSTSSGGIATVLSKYVISIGGVVYGAAFDNELNLKHCRIEKENDLEKLKGSKYTQSAINDSYYRVKTDLENDIYVLFIGTPCQVDGLLKYLRKEYPKLLTVNLICHGTPNNRLLLEDITTVHNASPRNKRLSFRNDSEFGLNVTDTEGKRIISKDFYKDFYFLGFMRKLFYREACYSCKYAQRSRVGDFTIGDFWGFDHSIPFVSNANHGLSVVLINTEKGLELFDFCKHLLHYQERTLDEAVKGNPQLNHPSEKHRNYDRFRNNYKKHGFKTAAERSLWFDMIGYKAVFLFQRIMRR